MDTEKIPAWYRSVQKRHKRCLSALEKLGKAVREEGPLDEKTAQLIQLAAAASIRSEGSVHSHARRALQAGATADEIYHTLMLLTSTVGFPIVSAALSWVQEIVDQD